MKNDLLDVYIIKYPFVHDDSKPICNARVEDINNSYGNFSSSPEEKYYGWRLLEYACLNSLGATVDSLNPRKLETGKWVIDKYYISLSNSGSYVMVGVSSKPIGVDIQKIRAINADYFINEEMCNEEIEYYKNIESWKHYYEHVEKEAVYKCFGTGKLDWKKINTLLYKDKLYTSEYHDYIYSICSELILNGMMPSINIPNKDDLN